MSIVHISKLASVTTYDELGLSVPNNSTEVALTYTVARIVDFDGSRVTAEFTVSIAEGTSLVPFRLNFGYSGEGNPMEQAEPALSAYFAAQDAAAAAALAEETTNGEAEQTTGDAAPSTD